MSTLTLKLLEETFAIHSLASDIEIPKAVFDAPIFFIAKTCIKLHQIVFLSTPFMDSEPLIGFTD